MKKEDQLLSGETFIVYLSDTFVLNYFIIILTLGVKMKRFFIIIPHWLVLVLHELLPEHIDILNDREICRAVGISSILGGADSLCFPHSVLRLYFIILPKHYFLVNFSFLDKLLQDTSVIHVKLVVVGCVLQYSEDQN